MAVLVKLSATLRAHVPDYDPMAGLLIEPDGLETVGGLVRRIGVPADEIKIILLNGRAATLDAPVADGDRLGLFPPVGGG